MDVNRRKCVSDIKPDFVFVHLIDRDPNRKPITIHTKGLPFIELNESRFARSDKTGLEIVGPIAWT